MAVNNIICAITGKTGTGKSTLLKFLISEEYKKRNRNGMVILDYAGEHREFLKITKKFKHLKISRDIFNKKLINWEGLLSQNLYIIIEPYLLSANEYKDLVNSVCGALLKIKSRTIIIEETHLAAPLHQSVRENLGILITTGRKVGLDCFWTTQKVQSVNASLISESNIKITFLLDDINTTKRLRGVFTEKDILDLKKYEFLLKNSFTGSIIKGNTGSLDKIKSVI